jgi:hypothetical protein
MGASIAFGVTLPGYWNPLNGGAPRDPRAAFRVALDEARGLVTGAPDEFFPAMVDLCAQAGVALVLVSEVKGAREWSESLDVADQGRHSAIDAVSVGGPLLVLVLSRGRSPLPARQAPRLRRLACWP